MYTSWYDPGRHSNLHNITKYVIKSGYYEKIVQTFNHLPINLKKKQPELSPHKNCTAALFNSHIFAWMTISCAAEFEASYICQRTKVHSGVTLTDSFFYNHTCDNGWFMVSGGDKCFSMTMIKKTKLSYNEANDVCHSQNASILKVEAENNVYLLEDKKVSSSLIDVLYKFQISRILGYSLQETYLRKFGKPLVERYPYQLLEMIMYSRRNRFFFSSSSFFVNSNGKCNDAQPTYMSVMWQNSISWGDKCLKCSKPVDVGFVVCENDSYIYSSSCADIYYRCEDGTCILQIYVCDGVIDCFDSSDEVNNCYLRRMNSLPSQTVSIPCILVALCGDQDDNIVHIHDICDGIRGDSSLTKEDAICYQHRSKPYRMAPLSTSENSKVVNVIDDSGLLPYNSCDTPTESTSVAAHSLIDTVNNHCDNLNTICRITRAVDREECPHSYMSSDIQTVCGVFSCPGMFKCYKHVCILMSSVCDGYYDCEAGDDEISCPITSCPGMLKCRGENRCVSEEEICDQTVSCLYSMDDEFDCHRCHHDCECIEYSVSCTLNNSLSEVSISGINNIKSLKLKGLQQNLSVHHLHFRGLVYVNASFCDIVNIMYFTNQALFINAFIIIADFSHNHITNTTFFKSNIFANVVYLELSFNKIYIIHYNTLWLLDDLVLLSLKGNPINLITLALLQDSSALLLIDIQYIYDYNELGITLDAHLYKQVEVKVSDSMICCILSTNINCKSTGKSKLCYGLLKIKIYKFSFYILSILALLISVGLSLKQAGDVKGVKFLNRKKKYFFIILLNQSTSVIIASLYLVGLICADVASVNVFFWRRSNLCIVLNVLLYISLASNIIFKSCLVIIVALQIIYPFKHQCMWLKWTGLFSMLIWIAVLATYFLNLYQHFELEGTYDIFCSIGMCDIIKPPILLNLICFVNCALFVLSAFILKKTFTAMGKSKENLNLPKSNQNQKQTSIMVILKIAVPTATELPFQIALILLLIIKLANISISQFCQYIFLFVLPLHIIYSSIILLYRLKQ